MHNQQISIGKEKAIELANTNWWEKISYREIAAFQLHTVELCLPFDIFHEAVEKSLGRPVLTHEFGLNIEGIIREFNGEKGPPTLSEVLELIPQDISVLLACVDEGDK